MNTILPGTRLGPYEVVALAGSGGMGQVYKARDTRLDRTVAIKVMPANVSADPDLRTRFEREARAISTLDHPNICVLHDVGREGDVDYLVMQFLEGETLAARLARGPIPLPEALRHGIEIAAALDRAHRAGILHRDLKPGNVMLTVDGAKLLDFGLAKLLTRGAAGNTVLVTASAPLTGAGTLLGTLLYMSPEQLEGGPVDARSDIFSFGAVIYEMLTGARAFEGQTQASIIAGILERDPPPLTERAPLTPPPLDRVVRKCLAKDPEKRWQSARDLGDELSWISQGSGVQSQASAAAVTARPGRIPGVATLVAALALLLALMVVLFFARRPSAAPPIARHLNLAPPEGTRFVSGGVAISPDAHTVAYVAATGDPLDPAAKPSRRSIYLRRFDDEAVRIMPGTEGGRNPFFSPDGLWIGFFTSTALMKVSVLGGAPIKITDVPPVARGGAWGPDGIITYSPTQSAPLVHVSASGAAMGLALKTGSEAQLWPELLPGATHVIFSRRSGGTRTLETADIILRDVQSGQQRVLVQGGAYARYAPSGHLLFVRGTTLIAVPFDLSSRQIQGSEVPIVDNVAVSSIAGAHYAVAADGTLVVLRGSFGVDRALAVWVDRAGQQVATAVRGIELSGPRIAPDGRRAVIGATTTEGDDDIYMMDVVRNTLVRFSNDTADDFGAVWTPDGKSVLYTTFAVGTLPTLVVRPSDGGTKLETLIREARPQFAGSVSIHRIVAYSTFLQTSKKADIVTIPLDGERKATPFVSGKANEYGAEFSPDGRWIAYVSDEAGGEDVYVVPYPGPGEKRRISTGGGVAPAWCLKCPELYYQSPAGLMGVNIEAGGPGQPIAFGEPRLLFKGAAYSAYSREDGSRQYDVTPDGKRFLMLQMDPASVSPLVSGHVLLDWSARLTQQGGRH